MIHYASPGAATDAQAGGDSLFDHLDPSCHARMKECFEQVQRTGEPRRLDARGAGKQASSRFDYRVSPIRRGTQIVALSVVVHEISEPPHLASLSVAS